MYFTQEDYKKIENWLHRNSVKDTEFQEALPFTGKEIVTVVQDGHNRKVNIQEFINQLYKYGVKDFLNVTNTYRANNITLKEAIRLIPAEARKEGQVITFLNTDGNWEIYQFIGKLNQWDIPTLWNNPFDWEKFVIDSILPDEEDLTKSEPDAKGNSYLSLKDRKYEPDKYSGLGRKILRRRVVEIEDPIYGTQEKNLLLQADFAEDNTVYVVRYDFTLNGQDITLPDNSYIEYEGGSIFDGNIIDRAGRLNRIVLKKNIVNGKNILTQEMVSKSNTIYEIRYDFDLRGKEIIIPEGCILQFNGGSIKNGRILFNFTILQGDILILCDCKGHLDNKIIIPDWFGFVEGDKSSAENNYTILKMCTKLLFTISSKPDSSKLYANRTMEFKAGNYYISGNSPLWLNRTEMMSIEPNYRYRSGGKFKGQGKNNTRIIMINDTESTLWFGSNEDINYPAREVDNSVAPDANDTSVMDNITFEGISFSSDLAYNNTSSKSNVSGFEWRTYGWEKNNLFLNCSFDNLDVAFDIKGYGNCDHNRWIGCTFSVFDVVWRFNNNQSVDNTAIGVNASSRKDIIQVGQYGGGDLAIVSGSLILNAAYVGNEKIDNQGAIVHRLPVNINSGPSSGDHNGTFTFEHVRIETYGSHKNLIYTEESNYNYGNIRVVFKNSSFSVTRDYINSKNYDNDIVDLKNGGTCVLDSCQLSKNHYIKCIKGVAKVNIVNCAYNESFIDNPYLLKAKCTLSNDTDLSSYIVCSNLTKTGYVNNLYTIGGGFDFEIGRLLKKQKLSSCQFLYPSYRPNTSIYMIPKCKITGINIIIPPYQTDEKHRISLKIGQDTIYNIGDFVDLKNGYNINFNFEKPFIIPDYPNNYIQFVSSGNGIPTDITQNDFVELNIKYI